MPVLIKWAAAESVRAARPSAGEFVMQVSAYGYLPGWWITVERLAAQAHGFPAVSGSLPGGAWHSVRRVSFPVVPFASPDNQGECGTGRLALAFG